MAGTWALQLFLLCLTPALLPSVKINAKGREVIYLAKGDSVKLGCPYELEPQDHGPNGLDIEWTQVNSDPTNLDNVVLSYHDHQVIHPGSHYLQQNGGYVTQDVRRFGNTGSQQNVVVGSSVGDCCSGLQQRVTFAIPDPSQYDASINLQNVQISDSATYECKVKKTTVATRKVTVTVLVGQGGRTPPWELAPSNCHQRFSRVGLKGCWLVFLSSEGPNPGELVIQKLSHEHVGVYQCSVANKVGSARCVLDISFSEGKRSAFWLYSKHVSIIVGAVLGSLLFLLLLVCLIVGLIYCCRRKRCKEQSNQIRVDKAPPRARGRSRNSLRSVLGCLPHNISFMQRQKYESPKEQEGVEMRSPAHGADPSSVVSSVGVGIEACHGTCPSVVTTKARVHCEPSVPSYTCTKSGTSTDPSPQSPLGSSLGGRNSSTSNLQAAQAKWSNPRKFGGVPVMVPAKSREGLVI
ncbi:V-set and immunoglobulin domain-containing protein 8-like [Elgaria multicarinata webbii]|uniref:V-set and immunoglobulin domain-containing protein 8-like n=1 Tax=Elgaria multicarinata webbii TaxID=159646 RepID=UPI002FCD2C22